MKHRRRIEAATTFIEICITLSGGSYKFSNDTQSFLNQSYPGRWSLGTNQLSGPKAGQNRFTRNRVLTSVVQRVESPIRRINLHPVDIAINFPNTYPLDSDLSSGLHYPTFEQPGPGLEAFRAGHKRA